MVLLDVLVTGLGQPTTWVAVLSVVITVYLLSFIYRVKRLPPGPLPLPFLGNILQLRQPRALWEKAADWSAKYGDPMTVWIGKRPFLMASTKESFRDISGPLRSLVADRPPSKLTDLQMRGNESVGASNFTPAWDVLRRLLHVAIRKYARTDKLADLVATTIDQELDEILDGAKEKPSDIVEFIENVITHVLTISTFGESLQKGGEDSKEFKKAVKLFELEASSGLPSDILPILGWVLYKKEKKVRLALEGFLKINDKLFEQAKNSWTEVKFRGTQINIYSNLRMHYGQARHFTDVLLSAREEFCAEDRNSAKYLHDANLKNAVFDILGAGLTTTKSILGFSLIYLADHVELQEQLRAEIMSALGSNVCLLKDRARLPMTDAFLQEIIRFYPPAPLGVGRRTQADVTINGRSVPKHTDLFLNIYAVNRDKSIWGPDADEFKPSRFLDASKDQVNRGATSFGIGARSCVGEKMAQADIFYTLVRTLQKVKLSCIEGSGPAKLLNDGSDLFQNPVRQNVIFTRL